MAGAFFVSLGCPRNQSPSGVQPSPNTPSNLPKSVTQNSSSAMPTTPPTITLNNDFCSAIIRG